MMFDDVDDDDVQAKHPATAFFGNGEKSRSIPLNIQLLKKLMGDNKKLSSILRIPCEIS